VYTDIAALALFLIGYLALLYRRHWLAALIFVATLLVRQDMIVFIAGLVAIDIVRRTYGARLRLPTRADLSAVVRAAVTVRYLPYYVLAGLFGTFVYFNGGVAFLDKQAHPAGTLHWGNIYFALVTFTVVFLPIVLATLPRIVRMVTRSWQRFGGFVAVVIGGYVFYDATLVIDHAYNFVTKERFLHNDILIAVAGGGWERVVFYGAVVLALMTLVAVPWHRAVDMVVFAPFALLALALHWLIEPRYALVPLVLSALWTHLSRRVLRWQIVYGAGLCIFVYTVFIAKANYFL